MMPYVSHRAALLAGLVAIGATAVPTIAGADPVIRTSATVTGGVAYESNPFLLQSGNTDAASAQIEFRPVIDLTDERDSAQLAGYYNHSEYFSKYSGNDAAGVAINGRHVVNSRWTVGAAAGFDSSIIGLNNGFGIANNALIDVSQPGGTGSTLPVPGTGTIVDPATGSVSTGSGLVGTLPVTDIGLIGRRQRSNTLTGSAFVDYTPSARSTWNFGVNGYKATYPGNNSNFALDNRSLGATIGYNRRLSETSTVGARVGASFVKYENGAKTQIYSPQITYRRNLTRAWSVDVAAGASFLDSNGVVGSASGTSLNVQAALCNNGELSTLCINAARAPNVTGFAGVMTQTTLGLLYTRRLSEKTTLSAGATYARTDNESSNPAWQTTFGNQDFWTGNLTYARKLTQRISIVASGQYRDASFANYSPKADISGRLGVSLGLGDVR